MEVADVPTPLSVFTELPAYNIKAVSKRTGISPATLRAWERRHGLPSPNRTQVGYRLYSERDVAILFWLAEHLKVGITIGQAAQQLHHLIDSGHDPEVRVPPVSTQGGPLEPSKPRSPDALRTELVASLVALDERSAEELLTEAAALYTPETTLMDIFQAAFRVLHEQAGQVAMIERFALNYARQRLVNTLQIAPTPRFRRSAVMMGFADEHNEIDLLILGLLLRRQGWPVVYLGSDLDPNLLGSALSTLDAGLILFYTDVPANAARLRGLPIPVDAAGQPISLAVCGHALEMMPDLRDTIPAAFLGADPRVVVRAVGAWLAREENRAADPHEM